VTLPFPKNHLNLAASARLLMSIQLFGSLLLLAAFTEKPAKTEDVRPVRVLVLAPSDAKNQV